MTGVKIEIAAQGLEQVAKKLGNLGSLPRALILDRLGALGVQQTKKRIAHEKTAPDGAAWKPNATGTSILVQQGHLRDSMHHIVAGDTAVRWGSGLIYAAIHQVGGTIVPKKARKLVFRIGDRQVFADKVTIPARPYLGLSAANRQQMERMLVTLIGRYL